MLTPDADPDKVARLAAQQARILGAPEEEIKFAASTVESVLTHPLIDRARQASKQGQCRRETPVTLCVDGRSIIVEGMVDLAFQEDGVWTVVDFKTDHELAGSLPAYKRQVALYAEAISCATGVSVQPVLMRL